MASTGTPGIPSLPGGGCQVWWASTRTARPHLVGLLDDDERRRHEAFVREADRARFVVAHALARIVAAAHATAEPRMVRYSRGTGEPENGRKPRFTGVAGELELSISHSGERVVVALGRGVPVGVDVELTRDEQVDRSLVDAVLGPAERDEFGALAESIRAWAFCRYWTRKEAILKASGHGLGVSPRRIEVTPATSPPALRSWEGAGRPALALGLHDLDAGSGYTAALATIGSRAGLRPTEHDGDAVLRARA